MTASYFLALTSTVPLTLQEAKVQSFGPDDGIFWMMTQTQYSDEAAALPELDGLYALSFTIPKESKTIRRSGRRRGF